jgi:hypothetical protein
MRSRIVLGTISAMRVRASTLTSLLVILYDHLRFGRVEGRIGALVEKLDQIDERLNSDISEWRHSTSTLPELAGSELAEREAALLSKLTELRGGTYRLETLAEVYREDAVSINELESGEDLYSTCPVPPGQLGDISKQFEDAQYKYSMDAHINAAKRGVAVTRIYMFQDAEIATEDFVRRHLREWDQHPGLEIRVSLRDRVALPRECDFLVFGRRKVCVGESRPGAGLVDGATVYTDPAIVDAYRKKYQELMATSRPLEEMLASLGADEDEEPTRPPTLRPSPPTRRRGAEPHHQ